MLYSEKETIILQALIARKGMQHIVDTAAQILGNPLFVCDLGYKILCYSRNGPAEDPFWKYLLEHDYSMPEPIFQIMRSGDFAKVYALDDPQIGQYDFAQYPFLAARIRDGSHVMGHICVYASGTPFQEEDQKLLVLGEDRLHPRRFALRSLLPLPGSRRHQVPDEALHLHLREFPHRLRQALPDLQ